MTDFAWTPGAGSYKFYPPYVNLTGNRLAVRGYEKTDGPHPVAGGYVAVELPPEALAEFAAALEGTGLMTEWQPIETAPRDGTPVIVTNGVHVMLAENLYDSADSWVFSQSCSECRDTVYPAPTHWMPLPALRKGTSHG